MNPIIDAEQAQQKKPMLKMIYHFPRILDSDIAVEGETEGQCLDKAIAERTKMCKPVAVKGEIIE
jgi:hypothetical protein